MDTYSQSSGPATPPVTPVRASTFSRDLDNAQNRGQEQGTQEQEVLTIMSSPTYPTHRLDYQPVAADYQISQDEVLGQGRFSIVYAALQMRNFGPAEETPILCTLTPPATPTKEVNSSLANQQPPHQLAVKIPADRQSIAVLLHEANILSYLTSCRGHTTHIVPFHGFDVRNNGLILSRLPCSLHQLIVDVLEPLPESLRAATVASIFPSLALSLVRSLDWLHSTGIIHADIKPANVLLQPQIPLPPGHSLLTAPFTPLLSDFTSAFHHSTTSSKAPPALAGGTYDFLAPELLKRPYPHPTRASDVFALAVTLLVFVTGELPFAHAPNRFMLLDWAKQGTPLAFAEASPRGAERLRGVAQLVHDMDVMRFFNSALQRVPEERRLELWVPAM